MKNFDSKQYKLFEEEKSQPKSGSNQQHKETVKFKGLKLSKFDTKQESRLKKLIGSRLKKIDKLNKLLDKDKQTLKHIKDLYQQNLSDHVDQFCKEKELYTEKLINRYSQKSFPLYQKDTMEYLIEDNFDELYPKNYNNKKLDELVEKYNELKSIQYGYDDEFEEEENFWDESDDFDSVEDEFVKEMADEFAKNLITEMLKDIGLDVDEEFFEGLDPNDADFQDKFQERLFEYSEHQKNTEKVDNARKKVISTDKEFTKLYKSLVKKIHPDLTTDDNERQRREVLMKELSSVWEQRDYYQLMILQSRIDPDFNGGMELEKSQLQKIADDLLKKSEDIEIERYRFKKEAGNDFYFDNFFAGSDRKILLFMENYKAKLKAELNDINKNVNFISYGVWWIKQAILKAISEQSRLIRVPANISNSIVKINKHTDRLSQMLGRKPTIDEIAWDTDLSKNDVNSYIDYSRECTSLEKKIDSSSDDEVQYFIKGPTENEPHFQVEKKSLSEEINAVLDTLSKKEKTVLIYRFGLNNKKRESLEKIGKRFGVSKERIRQIEEKALNTLRTSSRRERLAVYLEEN